MRFVVVFFVVAGLWLVLSGYWDGRKGVEGFADWLTGSRIDENTPTWGDVADKIGELAEERKVLLRDGVAPVPGSGDAPAAPEVPTPQ